MTVRRVGPGDEALWAQAVTGLVPSADRDGRVASTDELRGALTDPRCLLYVAREADVVLGLLSAYCFPDVEAGGHIAYLYDIEVDAARRRQGTGRALVDALIDDCRSEGVHLIWAGTEATNRAARRTFEASDAELEGDAYVEYEWDLEE
jgi:ribosomal protein S18 acetylase RimI-like enzyme